MSSWGLRRYGDKANRMTRTRAAALRASLLVGVVLASSCGVTANGGSNPTDHPPTSVGVEMSDPTTDRLCGRTWNFGSGEFFARALDTLSANGQRAVVELVEAVVSRDYGYLANVLREGTQSASEIYYWVDELGVELQVPNGDLAAWDLIVSRAEGGVASRVSIVLPTVYPTGTQGDGFFLEIYLQHEGPVEMCIVDLAPT